ncbi:unnamed protein product [Brassica oleracea]
MILLVITLLMCDCVTGWEVGQSQEKNSFIVGESQLKYNICSIDHCCDDRACDRSHYSFKEANNRQWSSSWSTSRLSNSSGRWSHSCYDLDHWRKPTQRYEELRNEKIHHHWCLGCTLRYPTYKWCVNSKRSIQVGSDYLRAFIPVRSAYSVCCPTSNESRHNNSVIWSW